jgi:DNA-binding MltR family transcriptional regulator
VNLQCPSCNTYRGGELDKYTIFLIKKYGIGVIEELDKLFHEHKLKHDQTGKKYTKEELLKIIEELKCKIANL